MAFMRNIAKYGSGESGLSRLIKSVTDNNFVITGNRSKWAITEDAREILEKAEKSAETIEITLNWNALQEGEFSLSAWQGESGAGWIGLPNILLPAKIGDVETPLVVDFATFSHLLLSDKALVKVLNPKTADGKDMVSGRTGQLILNIVNAGPNIPASTNDEREKLKKDLAAAVAVKLGKTPEEILEVQPV